MKQSLHKVVLLGDHNVGKTSIRRKYMGEGFSRSYLPTLGADFAVKKIDSNDGRIDLQIWDIGGQSAFKKFVPSFLQNSSTAIFVFDLTEQTSFENLPSWVDIFYKSNAEFFNQIPLIFIGNKNDLLDKVVDDTEITTLIENLVEGFELKSKQAYFSKTSALTGENIENVFQYIVDQLHSLQEE